jgi:hypothetical protein
MLLEIFCGIIIGLCINAAFEQHHKETNQRILEEEEDPLFPKQF